MEPDEREQLAKLFGKLADVLEQRGENRCLEIETPSARFSMKILFTGYLSFSGVRVSGLIVNCLATLTPKHYTYPPETAGLDPFE